MVKIVRKDGVPGLYRGAVSFFFAFLGQYTMQMTMYELLTDAIIKKRGLDYYHEHQNYYVLRSSICSGLMAGFITNPLEVIVLRKQTQSGQSVAQLLKTEGFNLLTKGLQAKLMYTTCQSMVLFMSMNHVGRLFNTNLSEEKDE